MAKRALLAIFEGPSWIIIKTRHFQTPFCHFDPFLGHFGSFWPLLATMGPMGPIGDGPTGGI